MSTIKANTIQNVAGVEKYLAQAWVNFDGTGTPAIRASGNVSSITDNGVGDYTINFTVPFADANYAMAGACRQMASSADVSVEFSDAAAPTVSACRINTPDDAGSMADSRIVSAVFFR